MNLSSRSLINQSIDCLIEQALIESRIKHEVIRINTTVLFQIVRLKSHLILTLKDMFTDYWFYKFEYDPLNRCASGVTRVGVTRGGN